jgi:crotonobetainyl-CoA:carnitine CoA-transferase CaiB-like acyl-CoA transferase
MAAATAADVFADLHRTLTGHTPADIPVTGDDPYFPGRFRVTAAAAAAVGTATLAAANLLRARGTNPGHVTIDAHHAALAFATERWLRVDGEPVGETWAELSGNYRTVDGWVRLHCNYDHHAAAACAALDVPEDKQAVTDAVAGRTKLDVEDRVLAAGGVAAAMRSGAEWRAHPAGLAVRRQPLTTVARIADAPPLPLPPAARPLQGIRVLDLTHVIAGPVCGRTLAAHGADVLHVGARHLETVHPLVIDTGFGKRTTYLDLREPDDLSQLKALVADADVLVQSFRPGALAARGLGPAELAAIRPGIVVLDLSAYGHEGPWRDRRGFDSLVQLASGIADNGMRMAGATRPVPLPVQALDHATGWLSAAAVITAIDRQRRAGGSWWLRLALARTGAWLDDLGRLPEDTGAVPEVGAELMASTDSQFGKVDYLRVPGDLPGAPPRYDFGPHPPGSDPAGWW